MRKSIEGMRSKKHAEIKEAKCEKEVKCRSLKQLQKDLEKDNPGLSIDIGKAFTSAIQGVIADLMTLVAGTFHLLVAYALAVWASSSSPVDFNGVISCREK